MDVKTAANSETSIQASIVDDVDSLLGLAPPFEDPSFALCGDLLGTADPHVTNFLSVTFDRTLDDRLDHWRRHVSPELPTKAGIISAVETTRGTTTAGTSETVRFANSDVRVTTVSSPGDLTGLGMAVEKCLAAWNGDENHTVACIDSLTALLQYADTKRVFRFLHTLLARFEFVDLTVHAHMDPDAHDTQTLATIKSLFDAVVERDPAGAWQIQ